MYIFLLTVFSLPVAHPVPRHTGAVQQSSWGETEDASPSDISQFTDHAIII